MFSNAGSLEENYFLQRAHASSVPPTRKLAALLTAKSSGGTSDQFMNNFAVNSD